MHFTDINDLKTLKTRYRKLVKLYHPDKGGNLETMKMINAEYEQTKALLTFSKSSTYSGKASDSWHNKWARNHDETTKYILDSLSEIPDIDIDIIGTWIWVSGNTKAHAKKLKEIGLRWIPKRKKWAYSPQKSRKYNSRCSFDSIRRKYGSHQIKKKKLKR